MLIGSTVPIIAPLKLNEALQSVEVTHSDQGRSGFQLTFQVGRSALDLMDYSLLKNPLLKPFNRVALTVIFNITPQPLMDGIITNQQLSPGNEPGASTLTLTGEDISVMMDLEEKLRPHPGQPDNLIVEQLLTPYRTRYGLLSTILPPPTIEIRTPEEGSQAQHSTDLGYIETLAERYGYVFFVTPGKLPLTNLAYWGPPKRLEKPQRALSVNMGPNSNVETISFQYNGLAPNKVAYRLEDNVERVIQRSSRRPLVATPAPLERTVFFSSSSELSPEQTKAKAQGMVDRSLDEVVTATGELDALRYGGLLQPRGLVDLRGAGRSYDGSYYVKSVTHSIDIRKGEYRQRFTLTREGLGTLTPFVSV
jgi:hypothetical protein